MKYIIFIVDGAADYPIKELGGKTPLMVANKPNIDLLAKNGKCGLLKTIPENFSKGSAVANLSVLGYDPKIHFHGRGVLEAAAMGIDLEKNDVALRINTMCVEDDKIKSHSAGQLSTEEGTSLIKTIDQQLGSEDIEFYPGVSYRHLLVLKNKFSEEIECAPPHDHPGEPIKELMVKAKSEQGEKTAELLNKLIIDSKDILENHPVNEHRKNQGKLSANIIWPWSPGQKPSMKSFQQLYNIKGAAISAVDLVKGLGKYAGFDIIDVPGATGFYDTNYEGKADACVKALEDHDLVYLHVEAPDEAGHDGDLKLKIKCIEAFDERLLARVLKKIEGQDVKIALLPDHPTPVEVRSHVTDPVPFLICDNKEKDDVSCFDESSCKGGKLGLLEGNQFIKEFLD